MPGRLLSEAHVRHGNTLPVTALQRSYGELNPPDRLLLGAGPSNVHPRVYKAFISPIVEHLDPYFSEVMEETAELLRCVFRTRNRITFPISGTGTAGMEAAICNVVEPGEEVIVGTNGFFGERMKDIIERCGGKPIPLTERWGNAIPKEAVQKALSSSKARTVALVHAETTTGALQPLSDIAKITRQYDALLLVDTVTSLSGCEIDIDALGIDVCFSASQKCLNCPPGMAPITANERAMEKIRNRKTRVHSLYFDLSVIEKYWIESNRVYHHTAPILLVYAMREALRIVQEEGLEARWQRHRCNMETLTEGLEALGLEINAKENPCPSINAVLVPTGISDARVKSTLNNEYGITVSVGLGALRGKVLRIGLMGMNSTQRNVLLVLKSLENALKKEGFTPKHN